MNFFRQEMMSTRWWKAPKLKFSPQEMKSTRWWKRRNWNFLVRKWSLRGDESAEIEIFSSGNEVYEVMKAPKLKFSSQEMKSTRWWKRRNRNFLVRKWTLRGDKSAEIEIFSSGNEVYEVIKAPKIEIFSSGNEVYEVIKALKLKFSRQEMKCTRWWKRRNWNFLVRKWSLWGHKSAEIEFFSSGNEVYEGIKAPKSKFSRQEMFSTR